MNLEKRISTEKLRNLNSFPMIYHLYNYDKRLKNYVKNIVDKHRILGSSVTHTRENKGSSAAFSRSSELVVDP
jgi:hypothetical protein